MSEVTSVNGKTGAVVLKAAEVEAVATSEVGQPSGVASLNGSGELPEAQLPSSVVIRSAGGDYGLTPEEYGAVGNGVHNDTAAFQASLPWGRKPSWGPLARGLKANTSPAPASRLARP